MPLSQEPPLEYIFIISWFPASDEEDNGLSHQLCPKLGCCSLTQFDSEPHEGLYLHPVVCMSGRQTDVMSWRTRSVLSFSFLNCLMAREGWDGNTAHHFLTNVDLTDLILGTALPPSGSQQYSNCGTHTDGQTHMHAHTQISCIFIDVQQFSIPPWHLRQVSECFKPNMQKQLWSQLEVLATSMNLQVDIWLDQCAHVFPWCGPCHYTV